MTEPFPEGTLTELFLAQAARSPGAPAVIGEGRQWSYAELADTAQRLAHELRGRGIGRGDVVGVLMPRSPDVVALMLGISRAGAAFVPVDPDYPAERIGYLLADSGVRLVACAPETEPMVPEALPRWVVDVPAARLRPEVVLPEVGLHDLAYVIYTSGSTGRPKGVAVTHRGIGSLSAGQRERLDLGPGSRVLQLASWSFDASFWEMIMALLSGGALVTAGADRLPPHGSLAEVTAAFGVTHVTVAPSVLAVVGDLPAHVRSVVVAGEACPSWLVGRWARDRQLINAYGPTETTVCATMSRPLPADLDGPVTIGGPVAAAGVHLLDDRLRPVPPGEVGELCGGPATRPWLCRPSRADRHAVRGRPVRPGRADVPDR